MDWTLPGAVAVVSFVGLVTKIAVDVGTIRKQRAELQELRQRLGDKNRSIIIPTLQDIDYLKRMSLPLVLVVLFAGSLFLTLEGLGIGRAGAPPQPPPPDITEIERKAKERVLAAETRAKQADDAKVVAEGELAKARANVVKLVLRFASPPVMRPTVGRCRSICTVLPSGRCDGRGNPGAAGSGPFWI